MKRLEFIVVLFSFLGCCPACHADKSCPVNSTLASEADQALYKNKPAEAEKLYREQLQREPSNDRVRGQLVRAIVDQDRIADADRQAQEFLKARPDSAEAEVALARVLRRQGNIPDAYRHVQRALALDVCNGQAHGQLGAIFGFTSMNASGWQQIAMAHSLEPSDDSIQMYWMYNLPAAERVAAISDYIAHSPNANASNTNLKVSLDAAQAIVANRAQSCSSTSTVRSAKLPLQPLFTDSAVMNSGGGAWSRIGSVETRGPQDDNFPIWGWGLEVRVNGIKQRLLVSTEYNGIILTGEVAAKLKLAQGTKVGIDGVPGHKAVLDTVAIGDLEFQHCGVDVLENEKPAEGLDGVIGLSVFSNYLIALNSSARTLELSPLPPLPGETGTQSTALATGDYDPMLNLKDRYISPEMANWTRAYRIWSLWLIPVHTGPGPEHLFVLDTGTTYTHIDETFAKSITKVKPVPGIFSYNQKTQKREPVLGADEVTLSFAGLREPAHGLFVQDFRRQSSSYGLEIDGRLGLQSFPNMIVRLDYRDGLVQFAPN